MRLKKEMLRKFVFGFSLLLLSGMVYMLGQRLQFPVEAIDLDTTLSQLPGYTAYSLFRMLVAYFFSFFFAVLYGYLAATLQKAEGPMVALLDVLQSVPILGFFPVAVLFFVNLFQGSRIGIEVASIFLIFTSMSWNMAFSVYESFKTVPEDLREAAGALGLRGWDRFRIGLFPICIPRLIYSSMISWSGGWYFLIAAEIIAIGPIKHELPGLGSFLIQATESGHIGRTVLGLLVLIAVITCFSIFVWRPLAVWGEKFRYEFVSSQSPSHSFALQWYRKLRLFSILGIGLSPFRTALSYLCRPVVRRLQERGHPTLHFSLKAMGGIFLMATLYGLGKSLMLLIQGLSRPLPSESAEIPFAVLASFLRLSIAYVIALAWTLPVAYWVGKSPRALKIITPIAEIGAAIPAPALFPFFILFAMHVIGGMNGAAVLLILTGMQWYLLFNLIGGVQTIPLDLKEGARALGITGWRYWKRLYLPAIFPSLVTGSITAWGGGWNALIVSEYVVYQQETHSVLGIGAMLDRAIYESGDEQMILLTLMTMILTIAILNRFFWRRLYLYAMGNFKLEY
ncbi:MAG: ABC transporter permease subunit [Nitrospiria bacterium]